MSLFEQTRIWFLIQSAADLVAKCVADRIAENGGQEELQDEQVDINAENAS